MAKPKSLVAGFDLGGTKMLAAIYDDAWKDVARERVRINRDKDIFAQIVELLEATLAKANVQASEIAGLGIGVPGPMDPAKGVITDSPNLGFHNFPMKKRLEEALGCPVWVDNDCSMATYGEHQLGAARGVDNVVGLFPGTGLGGGLIINGQLYRGSTGAAGEAGHMIVQMGGPLCGCGQQGCLEAFTSRLNVAKDAVAMAFRGQAPTVLDKAGKDLKLGKIRSGALREADLAGDQMVSRLIDHSADVLGLGMANLVNILNPEMIVLGGGLVDALGERYVDRARRAMQQHAMAFAGSSVTVVQSELGDDAVVKGAAKMFRDQR